MGPPAKEADAGTARADPSSSVPERGSVRVRSGSATSWRSPDLFASTVLAALITWDIAFDLAAVHHVFFERRHRLLVVTVVGVLGAVAVRREAHIGWWIVALLAVPMAWVDSKIIVSRQDRTDTGSLVKSGFLVVTLLVLTVTFWVLLRLLVPVSGFQVSGNDLPDVVPATANPLKGLSL